MSENTNGVATPETQAPEAAPGGKKLVARTVFATEAEALAAKPDGKAERKLFPVTRPDGTVAYSYGINAKEATRNVAEADGYKAGTPYGLKKGGGGVSRAAVVTTLTYDELAAALAARGLDPKKALKAPKKRTTAASAAEAPSETLAGEPAEVTEETPAA